MCESRKTSIIVDIDNTIIDQTERKLCIMKELGVPILPREDFDNDLYLDAALTTEQKCRFEEQVWGDFHFDMLKPIPGATETLNKLSREHKILYVTGRPIAQFNATASQLVRFGFPDISHDCHDNLHFCEWDKDVYGSSFDRIGLLVSKCKELRISQLIEDHNVLCVISDSVHDISAGVKNGAVGFVFSGSKNQDQLYATVSEEIGNPYFANSVVITNEWSQILQEITHHLNVQSELQEIALTHSNEYASFLSDLDAKARMLLTIATFLSTTFFLISSHLYSASTDALVQHLPWFTYLILMLCAIGFISSSLAVVFAIRAFSSRHTKGKNVGDIISFKGFSIFIKTAIRVFFGKSITIPGTPIHDAALFRANRNSPMARLALFAFFKKSYRTIDPDIIRAGRLMDLRALNYKKAYPEIISRRFLFVGMILALCCFVSLGVSHLFALNNAVLVTPDESTTPASSEQKEIDNQTEILGPPPQENEKNQLKTPLSPKQKTEGDLPVTPATTPQEKKIEGENMRMR